MTSAIVITGSTIAGKLLKTAPKFPCGASAGNMWLRTARNSIKRMANQNAGVE